MSSMISGLPLPHLTTYPFYTQVGEFFDYQPGNSSFSHYPISPSESTTDDLCYEYATNQQIPENENSSKSFTQRIFEMLGGKTIADNSRSSIIGDIDDDSNLAQDQKAILRGGYEASFSTSDHDLLSTGTSESAGDLFDSDQLSVSEVSDDLEPLHKNEPLFTALNSVLRQLLYEFQMPFSSLCPQNSSGTMGISESAPRPINSGNASFNRKRDKGQGKEGSDSVLRPYPKRNRGANGEARQKSFACPYLKGDPIKYGHRCAKYQLSRIRDVKQHLTRRHTPERYCQRCLETDFPDDDSLKSHVDSGACLRRSPSLLDGISYQKHRRLSKKSTSSIGEEEQWYTIWDILYPGHSKPESPYMDMALSAEIRLFREYSLNSGPTLLREKIESDMGWMSSELTEEQRRMHLERVISQGINHLFDQWHATLSAGSSSLTNQTSGTQAPQASASVLYPLDNGGVIINLPETREAEVQTNERARPMGITEASTAPTTSGTGPEPLLILSNHIETVGVDNDEGQSWWPLPDDSPFFPILSEPLLWEDPI
ncbi:hypothetical protein GQ53DRAFT_830256 [Thozetella sp. PMI_491]|nr:hypothetical protein GQ53DRAFT_830256 [Thozetella sp. PMI_491]